MRKFFIFSLIGIAIVAAAIALIGYLQLKNTKSFSPEEEVLFNQGELTIRVFYNRPSKKGREIFGALVPYDEVWRTGANEATTFESNKDLLIEGHTLKAGKYSLWTIPRESTWTIIFNDEYGQWGINEGQPNRDPDKDVLEVDVHAIQQEQVFEQFTIAFEKTGGNEAEMVLIWDKTVVSMPFSF